MVNVDGIVTRRENARAALLEHLVPGAEVLYAGWPAVVLQVDRGSTLLLELTQDSMVDEADGRGPRLMRRGDRLSYTLPAACLGQDAGLIQLPSADAGRSWIADALRQVAELIEKHGIDLGGPLYHDPTGQALTPEEAVALAVPLAEPPVLDADEDGPAWRQGVVLDEALPLVEYGTTDAAVARACRFRADQLTEQDQ